MSAEQKLKSKRPPPPPTLPEATSSTQDFVASMSFAQMSNRRRVAAANTTTTTTNISSASKDDGHNNINLASSSWNEPSSFMCECDECGIVGGGDAVPSAIQQALDRYKRRKLVNGPIKRTQSRTLVKRGGNSSKMSVWRWMIPTNADPLLEFGNSHRLVWVKRFPATNCRIYAIGEGIVGSEAEESMREVMAWQEGGVYLVPSNGGKAVGWVQKLMADETATKKSLSPTSQPDSSGDGGGGAAATDPVATSISPGEEKDADKATVGGGPVELLIAKVPVDELIDSENVIDEDCWTTPVLSLIQKYIQQTAVQGGFIPLTDDDGRLFRNVMVQL